MKVIAVLISVLILALASCATTQSGEGGGSAGTRGGTTAAAQAQKRQDSFKTREEVYFAAGNTAGVLDEYTVFEWDPAFTNLLKETRYSASDAVLEKIEYGYQGSTPATKTTKIIAADEKGKEQEQVRTQVAYQYTQGRLQTETLKNKDGNVVTSYEYAYDGEGNRASRTMKNGKGAVMAETLYSYAKGRLASAETKSAAGNRISVIEYQYDGQGNPVKEESRNSGGKITSVLTMTWQNGLEMKNELTGADNTPQQRETNEYSDGLLTKKTIENIQGKSTRIIQYEYARAAGR